MNNFKLQYKTIINENELFKHEDIIFCARDPQIKADVYMGNYRLDHVDEMVNYGTK